jgi:hypothetical protein
LFPNKWLTASDLQGKAYILTIKTVALESLRDRFTQTETMKIVIGFDKGTKVMALNKTQCLKLVEITGTEEFNRWVGTRIQIKPGVFRGKDTIIISPPPRENIP